MTVHHHITKRAASLVDAEDAQGHPDDLLTTQQLALWFQCSMAWLEQQRFRGEGPKFIRLANNIVRYRRADALQFLQERAATTTKEHKARLGRVPVAGERLPPAAKRKRVRA